MEEVGAAERFSREYPEEPAAFSNLGPFESEEDLDDILDLAGGARDAIERHRSQKQVADIKDKKPAETKTECPATSQLWDLLYWRDVPKSLCVFGATLLLLVSLSVCSVISVCSYSLLSLLSVTISLRIYSAIIGAVWKREHTHPFRSYLEQDVALSADDVHKHSDVVLKQINAAVDEVKRLYLVEDLTDSLKGHSFCSSPTPGLPPQLALLLWILTCVGAVFNALTLLIVGDVAAFTCPMLYNKHRTQIDRQRDLIINYTKDLVKTIQMKFNRIKNKDK